VKQTRKEKHAFTPDFYALQCVSARASYGNCRVTRIETDGVFNELLKRRKSRQKD
jgi:hypothetical protein